MVKLFIDTATEFLFIAVTEDDRVLDSMIVQSGRKHSDTALYTLQTLLTKHDIAMTDVEMICIGAGPGSYSGIRIARIIAKTIQLIHPIPCFQFSTLEFLHVLLEDQTIVLHAGKEIVYARLSGADQCVPNNQGIYTVFDMNYAHMPSDISFDALMQLQLENIDFHEPNYIKAAL